jgi:hypothetical protein
VEVAPTMTSTLAMLDLRDSCSANMIGIYKTMQTMCDILLMQNPLPILIWRFRFVSRRRSVPVNETINWNLRRDFRNHTTQIRGLNSGFMVRFFSGAARDALSPANTHSLELEWMTDELAMMCNKVDLMTFPVSSPIEFPVW